MDNPIYTRLPPEAGEPYDHVWARDRPINGKTDAGRRFFSTQHTAITSTTDLTPNQTHDAVYISPREGALCTYSDDTYGAGNSPFMAKVNHIMKQFGTNRSDVNNVRFAGIHITRTTNGITTDGNNYPARLATLATPPDTPGSVAYPVVTAYTSVAAGHLWISRIARPDKAYDAALLCNIWYLRTPTPTC